MRLIDADKFNERVLIAGGFAEEELTEDFKDGVLTVLEMLKIEPSAQPEPQWIPCSERLPEEKTAYYLVTIANHGRFFTTTLPDNVETVRWDYDRRKGKDSWHWCTERTVIAWMPLPEPYKENT